MVSNRKRITMQRSNTPCRIRWKYPETECIHPSTHQPIHK